MDELINYNSIDDMNEVNMEFSEYMNMINSTTYEINLSDEPNDIRSSEVSSVESISSIASMNENDPIIEGGSKSFLTFNASVSNKKVIKDLEKFPFQIMASTRNYLTTQTINGYPEVKNENLLLHMNYITRVFNNNAIETNSKERAGLRQYAKLAERVGTKDILIHMPTNCVEANNIEKGLRIINTELLTKNLIVHLEIAPWSQDLIIARKIKSTSNPVEYISQFLDEMITYMKPYGNKLRIVFDTAHLYALGAEVNDQITLFNKYRHYMKYCHLNGNEHGKLTSDSHAPIMSNKSKIKNWEQLSSYLSKQGLICVAEITKYGKEWHEWEEYAKKYNFDLIPFHEQLSI